MRIISTGNNLRLVLRYTYIIVLFIFTGFGLLNGQFKISSPVFENGKVIPSKYAMKAVLGGKNISLPFKWEHVPEKTKSFALSIIDLHPITDNWVHWLIVDIPSTVCLIDENASRGKLKPPKSRELMNSFGDIGYGGPQPPKGSGVHKYEVTLYALSIESIPVDVHSSLEQFRKAVEGKILAKTVITGIFER